MRGLFRLLYRSRVGQAFRSSLLRDLRQELAPVIEEAAARAASAAAEPSAARAVERVQDLLHRTRADRSPQIEPLTEAWRDLEHVRLDAKVLGSIVARMLYESAGLGRDPLPKSPQRIGLTSKLCVQADMEAEWLRFWCGQLRMAPVYHRKVWEDCFVMQALWEADMLRPGRCGLGFAVGREKMPSMFVREGVKVVATDLAATDARAAGWQNSNEHAAELQQLHDDALCEWDRFQQLCSFRAVDMNAIPPDLENRFDFCWSICSLEHLGSIEHGLAFVENSLRCLKPGGVAVHTTEFNLSAGEETIDHHETVLFQKVHIEALSRRLEEGGNRLLAVDFDPGGGPLDSFVDVPPFPQDKRSWTLALPDAPHLRLSADGFAVTAIGLIIAKAS